MIYSRYYRAVLVLALLCPAWGCATQQMRGGADPATRTIEALAGYLEDQGIVLVPSGILNDPYLSVDAQRFSAAADGGVLDVYQFRSAAAAQAAMAQIQLNYAGASPARYYLANRLAAVYLGGSPAVHSALLSVMYLV